ncbi:MAG: hypothetical protein NC253_07350 [Ruminococcus sp.]|nr:hypothetical protein [Ruminococcus sp.]MCM1380548.1 hypothetical protein [Muribaculaceae bacterium]MCM1480782.1 hypothetical protein [Muribaculaceae bacterium]
MADYKYCKECSAPLFDDDRAIYRKLVFRGAEEFLCIDCLAKRFGCTRGEIERLIKYYRDSGKCTLFR